jgi:aarF domain-containing kinase
MVYGKAGVFDADRLIDLLNAFESFTVASQSSRGNMDAQAAAGQAHARGAAAAAAGGSSGIQQPWRTQQPAQQQQPALGFPPLLPLPLPFPPLPAGAAFGDGVAALAAPVGGVGLFGLPANRFDLRQQTTLDSQGRLREALK